MITALPHPLWHPLGHVRGRFQRWWQARVPLSDSTVLTQRNVYILPTRAGFMLGATLLVLLVAAINYQLNLGQLGVFSRARGRILVHQRRQASNGSGIVALRFQYSNLFLTLS